MFRQAAKRRFGLVDRDRYQRGDQQAGVDRTSVALRIHPVFADIDVVDDDGVVPGGRQRPFLAEDLPIDAVGIAVFGRNICRAPGTVRFFGGDLPFRFGPLSYLVLHLRRVGLLVIPGDGDILGEQCTRMGHAGDDTGGEASHGRSSEIFHGAATLTGE